MSSRFQNLSIVLAGAVAVACSKPSADAAKSENQAAESVPTLQASAPTADQPLTSALEAGQRSELTLVRPAERKPLQPVVVNGKGDAPGGETHAHAHNPALDLGEVTPTVTASANAPAADGPLAPALGPLPHGPALGSEGLAAGHGTRDPVFYPDRGPTILIRGGMGGIDDDCKNHPQGFPAGGIAINSRMPQVGSTPVMANNPTRQPFAPGRIAGGYGVPRRGIIR
jgi:hypothetical protein